MNNLLLNYLRFRPRGLITNAVAWIESQGLKEPPDIRFGPGQVCWQHHESELLTFAPPFDAATECFIEDYPLRICVSQPSRLFRLLDCRIHGLGGTVLSPDSLMFQEFTYSYPGKPRNHPIFRRRRFASPVRLKGSWATVAYPSSWSWFHWLAESLPRFKLIEDLIPYLNGVFIPGAHHRQIKETAMMMGLRQEQIIELSAESHYCPEVLFVPAFISSMNMPSWAPSFLQSKLISRLKSGTQQSKRLYISRSDARVRRLVNEEEIMSILVNENFQIVKLSELSAEDQAHLFYEAEMVVAPHGAGLANLLFCRPGVRVLELLGSQLPHLYYAIANTVGGSYAFINGECRFDYGQNSRPSNFSDFFINPQTFAKGLKWLKREA